MPKSKMPKIGSGNTDRTTKDGRHRSFCFTHFDDFHNIPNIIGQWRYMIIGREICPDTKNMHFQGYVYFDQKFSLSNIIKKLTNHLGKHPRVKICSGSPYDNIKYCSKDKDFYEFGDKPSQGARNDLNELKDKIFSGEKKVKDILCEDPFMYHQYGRTLEKLEDVYINKIYRTEMTTCEWIYGKSGTGKSHYAFQDYHPDTHYNIQTRDALRGWWDGYSGQNVVIINDFRGELTFSELCLLIDKWPYRVSRRNREPREFISKHIIITSCNSPYDIYADVLQNEDIVQLKRRIEVKHFIDVGKM